MAPDPYALIILFVVIGLSFIMFISFLVSPFVAWRKGYAPYYWLFASGPVGLVFVCCLPSLRSAGTPEECERLKVTANFIGSVLTGIALFLFVGLVALLVLVMGPG